MSSTFSSAWLLRDPRALSLLANVEDEAARIAVAHKAAQKTLSPSLRAVIEEQQKALPQNASREREVEKLARPGTAAVVTGQQVGLFLGPLYSFYKAASAIAVARCIEQESGVPAVPLFWLQTEDHDFAEIDHCHVPRPNGDALRLSVGAGDVGPRVSVAHRVFGADVDDQVAELEAALSGLPHAVEFLPLVRDAYRSGRGVAEAFALLLSAVFSEEGLIIFNPREARVAELCRPVYLRALERAEEISRVLIKRSTALAEAGFDVQVHVRPGAPLFFLHEENALGPRHRLDPVKQGSDVYSIVGTDRTISRDEVRQIIESDPLRISTSALLRPIVQDTLLPTVCYVGGPGEINYFGQLAPLYSDFEMTMPLIAPRARFVVLDIPARRLLEELGVGVKEAQWPRDELLRTIGQRRANEMIGQVDPEENRPLLVAPDQLKEQLLSGFNSRLNEVATSLIALEPRLADSLARTRGTVARAVERLTGKYARALGEQDRVTMDRVDRLRALLQPNGEPQERHYSLPYFACRAGLAELKRAVFAALIPFDHTLREISP